jgi:N-acetylmuramoyl-L-alanine amidase
VVDATDGELVARHLPTPPSLRLLVLACAVIPLSASLAGEARAAASEPVAVDTGLPDYSPLAPGDQGAGVARLQRELAEAGFFNHEVDGTYGETTASAVVAFHKYVGVARTDDFSTVDWHLLRNLSPPDLPDRGDVRDYLEVDIGRQLLFVVRDGDIRGILPVSTGGGHRYWSVRSGRFATASTPLGDFTLRWRQTGWACDSITGWCVYKYWAFTSTYGIHGYRSVPTVPASHGCVRLHLWDSDWIEHHLFVGMPVHIWEEKPAPAVSLPRAERSAVHGSLSAV